MKYKEYFDSLNSVLSDLHDDTIGVGEATTSISELNLLAAKSDNPVLIKYLANPQEQVQRIMSAREFEKNQVKIDLAENSYYDGYVDNAHDETSYEDYSSYD